METIGCAAISERRSLRRFVLPEPVRRGGRAMRVESGRSADQSQLAAFESEQPVFEQGSLLDSGQWSFRRRRGDRSRASQSLAVERESGVEQDFQAGEREKNARAARVGF